MQTIDVRYVGPSPARRVPGVGRMARGEWVTTAAVATCEALAARSPNWFELRRAEPEKKHEAPKKGTT